MTCGSRPTDVLQRAARPVDGVQAARRRAGAGRGAGADLVENTLKVFRGQSARSPIRRSSSASAPTRAALRRQVPARRDLQQRFGGAWDAIRRGARQARALASLGGVRRLTGSQLFGQALTLVRLAAEQAEAERAAAAGIHRERAAGAPAANHGAADRTTRRWTRSCFTHALTHLREQLGLDDPAVKALLGHRSPDEVAAAQLATRASTMPPSASS